MIITLTSVPFAVSRVWSLLSVGWSHCRSLSTHCRSPWTHCSVYFLSCQFFRHYKKSTKKGTRFFRRLWRRTLISVGWLGLRRRRECSSWCRKCGGQVAVGGFHAPVPTRKCARKPDASFAKDTDCVAWGTWSVWSRTLGVEHEAKQSGGA